MRAFPRMRWECAHAMRMRAYTRISAHAMRMRAYGRISRMRCECSHMRAFPRMRCDAMRCECAHAMRCECTHQGGTYACPVLYDRKWYPLVRDRHRSTANLLSFNGLYTSKSCWYFAITSACKYPQLTRTKFWACSKLFCGQIGLGCALAGKSWWDLSEILCMLSAGELRTAKIFPLNLPARLTWKGVTGD